VQQMLGGRQCLLWVSRQELSDVSAALVGCGHVSALLVRGARTWQKRACCRYHQSLVLYLLCSADNPWSSRFRCLPEIRERTRVLKGS
jgi:hypothetical protein